MSIKFLLLGGGGVLGGGGGVPILFYGARIFLIIVVSPSLNDGKPRKRMSYSALGKWGSTQMASE